MKSSVKGGWVSIVCYLEFSSLMACEKKLSRVLLVRVLMLAVPVCLMVAVEEFMARVACVSDDLPCFPHTSLGVECPGGREAHFRQCAGPSELFYAGLSGWERCSSRTRQWCSQSGCSPFVYKASVHNGTYVCLSVNKNENRNETYSSLPAVCRSCPSGKWVKHKHIFIK